MKSRLLILDANVIIEAHRCGFWETLISQFEIHVPSIVLRNEVTHFRDKDNNKVPIDLSQTLAAGDIKELCATSDHFQRLNDLVKPELLNTIDPGETEAVSLLISGEFDDFLFCTGDQRAVITLSILSCGTLGVSLEEVLAKIGQQKKLPNGSYSKQAFDSYHAKGMSEQSLYLKPKK